MTWSRVQAVAYPRTTSTGSWLHPTARLGKKAEARGGDKTAAAAQTWGAVGMGRKDRETRDGQALGREEGGGIETCSKDTGLCYSRSCMLKAWDRKPMGSLKESFSHLQAAVESCSFNNWKSCLHLSTPAFLLLSIMFNES